MSIALPAKSGPGDRPGPSRHLSAPLAILGLGLTLALTGCANYEFDQARRADGSWDVAKLARDLEASEEDSLFDGIWIPLIYTDFTAFTAEDAEVEGGYTLGTVQSYGPVFAGGSATEQLFTQDHESLEHRSGWWALWGIAAGAGEERIQTVEGERLESSWRALLLISDRSVHYQRSSGATQ